jgi:tRNA threonylcarbamoyladenosine biosynthesis protein TsaE
MKRVLANAEATESLGAQLAQAITPGIIYLNGDLGAGKTTLARGFMRGLGYTGKVRSPTYTLVEPYVLEPCRVYHMDLYRLADAEELEWLGLRDMLAEAALLLVEWPERGSGFLPSADLSIDLEFTGEGREARLLAATPVGQQWLDSLVAADSG